MNFLILLATGDAVSLTYSIIKYVLIVTLAISAILLIISILMQSGDTQGLGEIGGGSTDTFLNKNKGDTQEARWKRWTLILGIFFVVGILGLTLLTNFPF